MYYIDQKGNYYAGDKLSPNDIEVSRRPSNFHMWSSTGWIIDETKQNESDNEVVKQNLQEIDLKSIRSLREYLIQQENCPQFLKDHEEAAVAERSKLK